MNDYLINLCVKDSCCCRGCYRDVKEKTVTLINNDQLVDLKRDCVLNVIGAYGNKALVVIRKQFVIILRFIYVGVFSTIHIPDEDPCIDHILTLKLESVEQD